MKDRIRKLILNEGLTSGAFADEIGVQRSSLSHILNGRNNPSLDFVIKTKNRFPKLNLSWLILGTGSMHLSETEDLSIDTESVSNSPTIFNAFPDEEISETIEKLSESPISRPIQDVSSARQVDKIVIFYSDQTFGTYTPEKSE